MQHALRLSPFNEDQSKFWNRYACWGPLKWLSSLSIIAVDGRHPFRKSDLSGCNTMLFIFSTSLLSMPYFSFLSAQIYPEHILPQSSMNVAAFHLPSGIRFAVLCSSYTRAGVYQLDPLRSNNTAAHWLRKVTSVVVPKCGPISAAPRRHGVADEGPCRLSACLRWASTTSEGTFLDNLSLFQTSAYIPLWIFRAGWV